jgi:hypothetical protein
MKNYIYSIMALFMVMLCPAQVLISQAEYFWDADPGTGNGTPVLAADGAFDDVVEQLSKTDITTPGIGLHKFNVRMKDNTGVWGPVFTNVINVQSGQSSIIIAVSQAEYFWDTDPGEGNGTPVLAADGTFDSVIEQLSATGVATPGSGLHKFNVRIKDNREFGDRFLPMSLIFSKFSFSNHRTFSGGIFLGYRSGTRKWNCFIGG